MKEEDLSRARDLFLGYSGSHLSMSRDGVDEEYRSLDVPPALEQRWLAQLTREHLQLLHEPGNWRAVAFLAHHQMWEHLDTIVAAGPLGEWWERCAFWETVVTYVEGLARTGPEPRLATLCDQIAAEARILGASQPADQPPGRSARLEDAAVVLGRRLTTWIDFTTDQR